MILAMYLLKMNLGGGGGGGGRERENVYTCVHASLWD